MKQFQWVVGNQAKKGTEVDCYYRERVQLLKEFISKTEELESKYNLINI